MSSRIIILVLFLNCLLVSAQEKTIKHTIVKGETISSIAEKYEVKQSAIFQLNPNAKKLLKLNSVLLIPQKKATTKQQESQSSVSEATQFHEVQAKQSLYAIAKIYGISLQKLKDLNPSLVGAELQVGQKINVPAVTLAATAQISEPDTATAQTEAVAESKKRVSAEAFEWEVLPKETKYSLTRRYGITIKEFDEANPSLGVKALQVGQKVIIPAVKVTSTVAVALATQEKKPTEEVVENTTNATAVESKQLPEVSPTKIVREVLPKETKYAIAKQYGLTVKELEEQNPGIKNGLRVGYQLNIVTTRPIQVDQETSAVVSINDTAIKESKIDFNASGKTAFNHDFLDQLIENASENIGIRYRSGGTTKAGFDCSGFMCSTFGAFDIKLPRTSREQSTVGVQVSAEEAKKGDLIFFKTNGRGQINHVGMVVEVNEGEIKFIHSSTSNGVIISSTKEKYYERNFSQINRVIQ